MKRAVVKLVVALLALLTAAVDLAAALVRLGAALVLRAACAARPRAAAVPPRGRPPLRVVPPPDLDPGLEAARARLTAALTGMGWPGARVRAFVDGLGERAAREPIERLIREGLAELAA
jgi:hypothetical protein